MTVDFMHIEEAMSILSLVNEEHVIRSDAHADEMPDFTIIATMHGERIVAALIELSVCGRYTVSKLHVVLANGCRRTVVVNIQDTWPFILSTNIENTNKMSGAGASLIPSTNVVFMYPEEWIEAVHKMFATPTFIFGELRDSAPKECAEEIIRVAQAHTIKNVWESVSSRLKN